MISKIQNNTTFRLENFMGSIKRYNEFFLSLYFSFYHTATTFISKSDFSVSCGFLNTIQQWYTFEYVYDFVSLEKIISITKIKVDRSSPAIKIIKAPYKSSILKTRQGGLLYSKDLSIISIKNSV